MKILFIGDIVSNPGLEVVNKFLPIIKKQYSIEGLLFAVLFYQVAS